MAVCLCPGFGRVKVTIHRFACPLLQLIPRLATKRSKNRYVRASGPPAALQLEPSTRTTTMIANRCPP